MNEFPVWKKALSYFWEFNLEKINSEFSGELQVTYHKNNLKLITENAIYSFGNHYTSFKEAFQYIQIKDQKVESVLVLGLGLGSVIQQLEAHQTIKNITTVEIDKDIIYLCKKYLNTKYNIEYINNDALKFVNENKKKYDLIIVDLYIDDVTPSNFLTKYFLEQLHNLVSIKGMLLFSKLEISIQNKVENDNFSKLFLSIFPQSFSINTNGNKIFIYQDKN